MMIIFLLWKDRFGSPGQLTASQHDASAAAFTFQTDVRTQACDPPFVRTAGMRFPHPNNIVEL